MTAESSRRVSAALQLSNGMSPIGEPLDAGVAVHTDSGGEIFLSIKLETGTEWLLELDPACAAYIAGTLAAKSGVMLG